MSLINHIIKIGVVFTYVCINKNKYEFKYSNYIWNWNKVGKINVRDSQSDFYIICWKPPDEDYPKIVETLGIKLNI